MLTLQIVQLRQSSHPQGSVMAKGIRLQHGDLRQHLADWLRQRI